MNLTHLIEKIKQQQCKISQNKKDTVEPTERVVLQCEEICKEAVKVTISLGIIR